MSHSYAGKCQCGATSLSLELPKPIEYYQPRACDCDFCTARDIAYLSEPTARLTINSDSDLSKYQQGSNQAEFLACAKCDSVIAASFKEGTKRIGSVNANLLCDRESLASAVTVSPKQLSADEKKLRWQELWMSIIIHKQ